MHIDGACHCGAVSFTAEVDPGRVMVCHCTDCQVLSGAPFRAVVAAPYESLAVTGTTKRYIATQGPLPATYADFWPYVSSPFSLISLIFFLLRLCLSFERC